MSFCESCFKGVRHEGKPEGTFEVIAGIKTYVAKPKGEYAKDKAVLFITDVFGTELINSQLLADDFALNGYQVYAPDLFEGDPAPASFLNDDGTKFDLWGWFPKHGPDHTTPRARAVLNALKEQGITKIGATGYCYGGRLVFNFAFEKEIDVAVTSHPSLLNLDDFDKFAEKASAPLLINSCEIDEQFTLEKQAHADVVFAKYAPGYSRPYFPGAEHGFAVRGDLSKPLVKEAKEGAFKNAVEWFNKYLI